MPLDLCFSGPSGVKPDTMAEEEPSEYEQLRLANIARNKTVMGNLGLDDKPLAKNKRKKAATSPNKKKKIDVVAPTRRSTRKVGPPPPVYPYDSMGVGAQPSSSSSEDEDEDYGAPHAKKPRTPAAQQIPPMTLVEVPKGKFDAKALAASFPSFTVASGPVVRDGGGDAFKFKAAVGAGAEDAAMVAAFRPNRSPEEVLRAGAFGGTYFRTIQSGVVKQTLSGVWKELPAGWTKDLDPKTHLARPWKAYDASVNRFGAKSGQTLEDWEASGWIAAQDPFGWFQWYCRFFVGRRSPDDARQIGRWLKCCGPTGRWKGNLCGKVVIARKAFDDPTVAPVVRQTLLHWCEAAFSRALMGRRWQTWPTSSVVMPRVSTFTCALMPAYCFPAFRARFSGDTS